MEKDKEGKEGKEDKEDKEEKEEKEEEGGRIWKRSRREKNSGKIVILV